MSFTGQDDFSKCSPEQVIAKAYDSWVPGSDTEKHRETLAGEVAFKLRAAGLIKEEKEMTTIKDVHGFALESMKKLVEETADVVTREQWDEVLDRVFGLKGVNFQIGDKVRLTGTGWSTNYGEIVTIEEIDDGDPRFWMHGQDYWIYCRYGDDFSATLVESAR